MTPDSGTGGGSAGGGTGGGTTGGGTTGGGTTGGGTTGGGTTGGGTALANGQSCSTGAACSSGFCTDVADGGLGVCCDTACTGGCQTCRQSRGATADGVCGAATAGTDPRAACGNYTCTGTAACPTSCAALCAQNACAPGFACNGSACVATAAAGSSCTADCQCAADAGCTAFYQDNDGDDAGSLLINRVCGSTPPAGYARAANDCCDSDARVFPGQTQGFSTPRSSMCGTNNFDFDCDSASTPVSTSLGVSCVGTSDPCFQSCVSATTTAGWATSSPACGVMGEWVTGTCTTVTSGPASQCTAGESVCQTDVMMRAQTCR